MNAPALHPAARTGRVLRECLDRQRGAYGWIALVLASAAVFHRMGQARVDYLDAAYCFLAVGALSAAFDHERPPVWDAAMPMDPARYARVRLLCGVERAVFLLAVLVVLYAALFADPGRPAWYPLALFTWGLTCHLLASAALLRHFVHTAVPVVRLLVIFGALLLLASVKPAELRHTRALNLLARTALPLGLAGAAAYAATRVPAPAGRAPRRAGEPRRDAAPALPERPAPPPARPAGPPARPIHSPNRPAPRPVRRAGPAPAPGTRTVFLRHLALLRRFTIVPALTVLIFAGGGLVLLLDGTGQAGEPRTVRYFADSLGLPWWCAWIALSWTVLVRLGEYGAQRRWNDTLPVGTAKRRILHATAGAAWLLLLLPFVVAVPLAAAAAAGTLGAEIPAWLWLGLPIRTLTLYLAATLILHGARPAYAACSSMATYVAYNGPLAILTPFSLVIALVIFAIPLWLAGLAMDLLAHLTLALAGDAGPDGGSHAASALWIIPYATAAAVAIALEDWLHQRARRPMVGEAQGFLRGWAGARPARPLRGHAGR